MEKVEGLKTHESLNMFLGSTEGPGKGPRLFFRLHQLHGSGTCAGDPHSVWTGRRGKGSLLPGTWSWKSEFGQKALGIGVGHFCLFRTWDLLG